MDNLFAKDYTGDPFVLFGTTHLATLAIILLGMVGITWWARRADPQTRWRIRQFFAILLLVNEASWHLWHLAWGTWTIQTMLPLHLCSVLVFVSAYLLWTGNKLAYEFVYLLGIAGALQALLTPDAGIYGFPHYRFFQTFISHGTIVFAGVLMTAIGGLRPTLGSIGRVALYGNLYLIVVFFINLAIGSNYLYVAHKPVTASILDLLAPWPWYILQVEGIAFAMVALLYLPWLIKDRFSPSPALTAAS